MPTKPSVKAECFFVLGGPGSGKGTQCSNLVRDFNFVHLSAGDLLRIERNSGSKNAKLIEDICKAGKIVPVEITVNLIKDEMLKYDWEKTKFLIDGFPRNQDNVDGWERVLGDQANVKFMLFLDCDEDTMLKRIMKRIDNSGDEKRYDDTEEIARKRIKTNKDTCMPIVEHFEKKGLVKNIDASAQPNEVYAKVREAFGDALPVLKSEAEPIAETTGLPLVLTEISGAEGCQHLIDRNTATSFESKSDNV